MSWTCPTCQAGVTTAFCPRCGEAPLQPRDMTLRGFLEKAFQAFTSIDARTLRSIRALLRHPGELTVAWMSGIRKPYLAPLSLFLIANVAFVALQSLTGQHVFNSTLESHLHHQDWSGLAQSLLSRRLEVTHRTIDDYAPLFDRRVALNAKSLVVLMSLAFSFLLPAWFVRAKKPYVVHLVFALHAYAFLLLLFSAALLVAAFTGLVGIGGIEAPAVDKSLSVAMLVACAAYLYLAAGPVYRPGRFFRAASAIVLVIAIAALVLCYRFALFIITLYTS